MLKTNHSYNTTSWHPFWISCFFGSMTWAPGYGIWILNIQLSSGSYGSPGLRCGLIPGPNPYLLSPSIENEERWESLPPVFPAGFMLDELLTRAARCSLSLCSRSRWESRARSRSVAFILLRVPQKFGPHVKAFRSPVTFSSFWRDFKRKQLC